jgi:hypothetical protein
VDTDGDGSDECVNTPIECPEGRRPEPQEEHVEKQRNQQDIRRISDSE